MNIWKNFIKLYKEFQYKRMKKKYFKKLLIMSGVFDQPLSEKTKNRSKFEQINHLFHGNFYAYGCDTLAYDFINSKIN